MTINLELVSAHYNIGENTHTRSGAKIQQDLALFQEAIFFVQLNKLEGSSGTITLFLGKLVPFIQTAFAVLLLDRHCGGDLAIGISLVKVLKPFSGGYSRPRDFPKNFPGTASDKTITCR